MSKPDVIKQPLSLVIVTFLAMMSVIIWRVATAPYPFETGAVADMPLGRLADGLLVSKTASYIFAIVIAFLNATLLTSILVRYSVSIVRTYLPMIVYTMMAYGVCVPVGSLSASLVSLLLITSTACMIASFRRSYQFGNVFQSALWLGVVPMIYAPAVVLVLILPVTLALYQRTLREAVVAAVGFALPFLLCSFGWWVAGYPFGYMWSSMIDGLASGSFMSMKSVFLSADIVAQVYICVYVVLVLYSLFLIFRRITGMRTRARKIYLHFMWLLVLCLGMAFLPGSDIISLGLLAVPGSVVISTFFIRHSGWITVAVYTVLLAFVFLINMLPLLSV